MSPSNLTIVAALISAAALCSGCKKPGTGSTGAASTASAGAVIADSTGPVTPSPPPAMGSTGVPTVMEQAEGLAEDVQDDISGAGWTAAQTKATQLQQLQSGLSATGTDPQNTAAFSAYVDTLTTAIQQKNRVRALTSANRVSRVMNVMMANYPTKVPIEVAYMDVAGRDAEYDAAEGDWKGANEAAVELGSNYATVKAHVQGSDAALDGRVSGELTQLQAAIAAKNASKVASLAKTLLEEVDNIEKTY